MPNLDQLEVISPTGEIKFYSLDLVKGVTNIGRHPDNDIVIDNPNIAPFHAVLDHRRKPYQIVVLSTSGETSLRGAPISPNVSTTLQNWDTIEVATHIIILLEESGGSLTTTALPAPTSTTATGALPAPIATVAGPVTTTISQPTTQQEYAAAAAAAAPPPQQQPQLTTEKRVTPAAPRLRSRQPDQKDDFLVAELAESNFTLDVEQTAILELTLVNGSPIVASFMVQVEGLDPSWVEINPPQVNLNDGQRESVIIEIHPPRDPSSSAGDHHFAITITSPEHSGRMSRLGGTLHINPYYAFAVGEISPKQQTFAWRKATGESVFQVTNTGNSTAALRVDAYDTERACNFEFELPGDDPSKTIKRASPTDVTLGSLQTLNIPVHITTLTQPFIGLRKRMHAYTVNASMIEGAQTQWSQSGQVKVRPIIGPLLIALIILFIFSTIVIVFNPSIKSFEAQPAIIRAGESTMLEWQARPFANLRLESDGDEVFEDVENPNSQTKVEPINNTTYVLKAKNFLTILPLIPRLFNLEQEITVQVTPVPPVIQVFQPERESLVTGEGVTFRWEVQNADNLILRIDDNEETLLSTELQMGERTVYPINATTSYELIATNKYVPDYEEKRTFTLYSTPPTATPLPKPQIISFDANPKTITLGESVTITWKTENATGVEILGQEYLPEGQAVQTPAGAGTVEFVLIAIHTDGEREERVLSPPINVKVNPPPEPTPEPKEPKIDQFEPKDKIVVQGITEYVPLYWSVSGDVSFVELSGPTLGAPVSNLDAKGSFTVSVSDATFFMLSAYYDDEVKATDIINIEAAPPPPNISYFQLFAATSEGELDLSSGNVKLARTYTDEDGVINNEYTIMQFKQPVQLSWLSNGAVSVRIARKILINPDDTQGRIETKIVLGNYDPQGVLVETINAPVNYVLTAINEQGVESTVNYRILAKYDTVTKPPHPSGPPTKIGSVPTDGSTAPITITWTYGDTSNIEGFRIWRFDSGIAETDKVKKVNIVADYGVLTTTVRSWLDINAECSKTYRVGAVYLDEWGDIQVSVNNIEEVDTEICIP